MAMIYQPRDVVPEEGVMTGDDISDLIQESLVILAERRAAWLGDDKAAIRLLANLVDKAAEALAQRVAAARGTGTTWQEIADALGTTPTEVRLRFADQPDLNHAHRDAPRGHLMDEHEVARRASALPDQFAARLPARKLAGLKAMERGGEYGELAIELAATLAKTGAMVSSVEQRELHALLEATGMPTDPVDSLTVRD